MEKIIAALVAALSLVLPIAPATAADLVETAEKSSEIRTFVEAIERSGLASTLRGRGPFTVFAPSNSAFSRLTEDEREQLFKDKKRLAAILSYHVMPEKLLVADVKPGPAKTMQGQNLQLTSDNGMVSVNKARVTLSDLEADNGVIHIIDTVLLPRQ